jgi:hypothetical protein
VWKVFLQETAQKFNRGFNNFIIADFATKFDVILNIFACYRAETRSVTEGNATKTAVLCSMYFAPQSIKFRNYVSAVYKPQKNTVSSPHVTMDNILRIFVTI